MICEIPQPPPLSQAHKEETWERLRGAVSAVLQGEAVKGSLQDLYRDVDNLCAAGFAEELFDRLRVLLTDHVVDEMRRLATVPPGGGLLDALEAFWNEHCRTLKTIRNIFLHLDRTYVLHTGSLQSIWEVGLDIFCTHFAETPDILEQTLTSLLEQVKEARQTSAFSLGQISTLTKMFSSLHIYESRFEPRFLAETRLFYRRESARLIGSEPIAQYVQHICERLKSESEMGALFLTFGSRQKLTATVEEELLTLHKEQILDQGLDTLLREGNLHALSLLYSLSEGIHALDDLRNGFKEYLRRAGTALVNNPANDEGMVSSLLEFKGAVNDVLASAFQQNQAFQATVKDSFEYFLNIRQDRPAELIAKHLDKMLSPGSGFSFEDFERKVAQLLVLFRFISGYDVFEMVYKSDLARRLLITGSADLAAEKLMIASLKTECGASFTSKFEGMFKDLDTSKELVTAFRGAAIAAGRDPFIIDETQFVILTHGIWPLLPPLQLRMDRGIASLQALFSDFYASRQPSRVLTWQNAMGSCSLAAAFPSGQKELQVSLGQACVLLLFKSLASSLSLEDIDRLCEIQEAAEADSQEERDRRAQAQATRGVQLKGILASLTVGPSAPLLHSGESDAYRINDKFAHARSKVLLSTVAVQEASHQAEESKKEVFRDRQYQVDAGICRVLKARKTISTRQLLEELQKQLKFQLELSDLNSRLESLIDREYVERDPSDPETLRYIS